MRASSSRRRQRGFSLIEIMVGLTIGMASVVIMLQMLANSDRAKRNASGGNDAQMNGTLALYTLERDIRASGYGTSAFNVLGCTLTYRASQDGRPVNIPLGPTSINPATTVVPAGDANTDTLLVMYGNGNGSSEGDATVADSAGSVYQMTTATAFNPGDVVMAQTAASASRNTPCVLTLDDVVKVTGQAVEVNPGINGMPVGTVVYNLGTAPVVHAFAVRNGTLTMCDYRAWDCSQSGYTSNASVWVPIAGNIAAMRAQYGRDTSFPTLKPGLPPITPYAATTYDQQTPGSPAETQFPNVQCAWTRTLAVRVGIVARSAAYDKDSPTTQAPTWSGSTVDASSVPSNPKAVTFDLSGNAQWKNFRYKALETTIPLRNAIWQAGQTTYQGGTSC